MAKIALKDLNTGSRTESILTGKERVCFLTGATYGIEKHHIFFGRGRREISDKYGFWVYLRHDIHAALHDHDTEGYNIMLKKTCQMVFEKNNNHEDFMYIIGRNYLDAEEEAERKAEEEKTAEAGGFFLL